jgi:hypothetical protein
MEKRTIKVIKKDERNREAKAARGSSKKTKRQATRDAISTVSGWVRDLQENKRAESRRAFESLFVDPMVPATEG